MPGDLGRVWDLIRRVDDLMKYAPNRDAGIAREEARARLDDAERAARGLDDVKARAQLQRLIALRRADLDEGPS
ncbi:MAG: hypothetical protein ABR552_09825 [Actinomycetota bacterium]